MDFLSVTLLTENPNCMKIETIKNKHLSRDGAVGKQNGS